MFRNIDGNSYFDHFLFSARMQRRELLERGCDGLRERQQHLVQGLPGIRQEPGLHSGRSARGATGSSHRQGETEAAVVPRSRRYPRLSLLHA